ncbi:hypothetical protein CWN94_03755 [Vibrio splendidus]|uniref:hypothetical protein n=1 Tax=Vibrio splendidus TaxID=29497 RepID=UPI000D36D98B|nr:hypothetical protein [Vibrio splendidus]PTO56701.1 hypothetical protein CWN94_03755 [Vibrio splendidus]
MSAKYSYLAWQVNTSSPAEKLVLLMLADGADEFGYTNVCLQTASQLCALSTFGLADCLKCLVDQGFLDKVKVDYRDKKEIHVFKMLIEQEQATAHVEVQPTNSIPVYSTAPAPAPAPAPKFQPAPAPMQHMQQAPRPQGRGSMNSNTVSTHDLNEEEIPSWAERAFKFSGLTGDHSLVWKKFVLWYKAKANELMPLSRIESKLQYWLVNEKQNERQQQQKTSQYSGNAGQAQGNGYRQKLSPSERFRQQLIQKGKKPTF